MIVGSLLLILVAVGLLVAGVLSGSNALIICSIVIVALAAIVLVIGVKQAAAADDLVDDDVERDDADATGEYPRVRDNGFRSHQGERGAYDRSEEPIPVRSRRGTTVAAEQHTQVIEEESVGASQAYANDPSANIPNQGMVDGHDRFDSSYEPTYDPTYEPTYATAAGVAGAGNTDTAGGIVGGAGSNVAPAVEVIADDDPPDEPSAQIVSASNAARVAMLSSDVLVIDGRPRYHVTGCVHLLGRESEPLPVGEAVELGFTPCGLCEPDSALLAEARRV